MTQLRANRPALLECTKAAVYASLSRLYSCLSVPYHHTLSLDSSPHQRSPAPIQTPHKMLSGDGRAAVCLVATYTLPLTYVQMQGWERCTQPEDSCIIIYLV